MTDNQSTKRLTLDDLSHCTGTYAYHRHPLVRKVLYTDGVKLLADRAQCHWLIDAIASYFINRGPLASAMKRDDRLRHMVFWQLRVNDDKTALLTAVADAGEPPVVKQKIEYTDFLEHAAFKEVDIWAQASGQGWVLMLPTEY